jgi:hypothetical protein
LLILQVTMILKAFKAGQDFDDDPEKRLLEEVRK